MDERTKMLNQLVADGIDAARWGTGGKFQRRITGMVKAGHLGRDEETFVWKQISSKLNPLDNPYNSVGAKETVREMVDRIHLEDGHFGPGTGFPWRWVLGELTWIVFGLLVMGWGVALVFIFIRDAIGHFGVAPVGAIVILIAGWMFFLWRRKGNRYLLSVFGTVCMCVCAVKVLSWILIFFEL